ncbi:MAG: ABC transporter ATP-binding protein [Candidatus Omnitrophica bacterium]|nr:ABC transporter ATP-binding protein [Candidatus Omnitrophota bacterium]
MVSLFSALSLFTISPLIDFLTNPDLRNISPLTQKAVNILKILGLPVTLTSWLVVFLIFITLVSVFQAFAQWSIIKTKFAVLRDIMLGTFKDFFNARWYFFSSGKQGDLLNTFTREITVVGDAFGAMALFFADILQLIFFLVVPFCISWQVTSISLGVALLFTLPFLLLSKIGYRLGTLNTSTANHLISVIQENLSLAKVVLGFGNQQNSVKNLDKAFDAHLRVTVKSQMLNLGIPIFYRPFGMLMLVIALFTARRFSVPLSETAVLLLALLQIAVTIGEITMRKNSLENFFPSYEQIKKLREQAIKLKQESGTRQFKGFDRELIIERLSFTYSGKKPVLVDINVRIPKGRMVAFVGQSGAGKSTFIDMIMGFHQPTAGSILFDGIPLHDFDIHSYRSNVGYVPQDSVLFNMSIRDNMLWAYSLATDKDISVACQQANADEFIRQLPEGYSTLVGDRGIRLSGGQVQRLALARAILRKPSLLILDEATSSLDTYSERLIQQAIENIAKETTVIVIAHRLSTITNADYIYVLKDGRLVEEGGYSELIQMNGCFSSMVRQQALNGAEVGFSEGK